jgi:hypothetical protein
VTFRLTIAAALVALATTAAPVPANAFILDWAKQSADRTIAKEAQRKFDEYTKGLHPEHGSLEKDADAAGRDLALLTMCEFAPGWREPQREYANKVIQRWTRYWPKQQIEDALAKGMSRGIAYWHHYRKEKGESLADFCRLYDEGPGPLPGLEPKISAEEAKAIEEARQRRYKQREEMWSQAAKQKH